MRNGIVLGALLGVLGASALPEGWVGTPAPAAAQQTPPATVQPTMERRGWLGIELYDAPDPAEQAREGVRIEGIALGSPAHAAGLRAGDVVLEVDGETATHELLRELSRELRPGREVRFLVERRGERWGAAVRAAERPMVVLGRPGPPLLERPGRARPGVVPRAGVVVLGEPRSRLPLDSLLPGRIRADSPVVVLRPGAPGPVQLREVLARGAVGAGPSVILGQRAVAGADLVPLNPGLSRYFGVEEGVLAVAVIDGTPAAQAGLRAGDVIVDVGGSRVTEVADVRRALARGLESPPVEAGIIRDGEAVTIRFFGDREPRR